jgi:hypothetical protein
MAISASRASLRRGLDTSTDNDHLPGKVFPVFVAELERRDGCCRVIVGEPSVYNGFSRGTTVKLEAHFFNLPTKAFSGSP